MKGPRDLHLGDLDALRGAAAMYVLVGHSRWLLWAGHAAWVSQPHAPWESLLAYGSAAFRFGREAVMVFFVLSGFFIHLRAAAGQGEATGFSTSRFYQRRAHRLMAPYVFALAVTVVCDVVGRTWFPRLYAAQTGDALLDTSFSRMEYSWMSVVPALALLPSSLGRDFGSNGPLWSLAFETVYYAIYPAWLVLRRRQAAVAFGVLPVACLSLGLVPGLGFAGAVLSHYPIWLAGAALAEAAGRLRQSGRLVLVSAGVFTAGVLVRLLTESQLSQVAAAMLFGTAVVAGTAVLPAAWRPARLLKAMEYFGVRSYSIYILHFPVLALLAAWAIQSNGNRPISGWLALAGAVLAVAFACVCFEICERHFLHARLRVRPADA